MPTLIAETGRSQLPSQIMRELTHLRLTMEAAAQAEEQEWARGPIAHSAARDRLTSRGYRAGSLLRAMEDPF